MTDMMRESAARLEDFEFTAGTGVRVRIDCALLRQMTPEETAYQKQKAGQLYRRLCIKYGVRPCG